MTQLDLPRNNFSTHFKSSGEPFEFQLGFDDKLKKGDEASRIEVIDDYFWSSWMQGIQIGRTTIFHYSFDLSSQAVWNETESGVYTIFNTASPDLTISNIWFDSFVEMLNETSGGSFYMRESGRLFTTSCDPTQNHIDVHFQVGWHLLTVRPIDYLWPEIGLDGKCGTRFVRAEIPFMILGAPVYRDYIVEHSDR